MIPDRWVRVITTVAAIAVPTVYLASLFPTDLMFADTTATGGDLGSHNYAAVYSTMLLWHHYQLTGWVPGNYCGFPLFQMYFPAPFVAIAIGATVLNPNVAYKLVSIAGVLALPGACWFVVRRLRVPFPGPEISAALTLLFLFQGGNAMWGGNLRSTLAGEFVYSLSLPLALVYLALERGAVVTVRRAAMAAALVAVLAMTHAYTILWVALTVGVAALLEKRTVRRMLAGAGIFAWGGALCAFWLLPLLWYSEWTTAYKHVWVINSITEILPPLLWPAVGMAVVLPIVVRVRGLRAWRRCRHALTVLVAGALAAALAYLVAPNFGIVDVRFLPFLQLALCLIAGAAAGYALKRTPGATLTVPIMLVAGLLLVQDQVSPIKQWIRWNYEGFERKALWPAYADLAEFLRGDFRAPRVAYEHAMENDALGTIRAFENLPLFTGRSTLEGVNLQASVTSPFIFFLQSEYSQVMSCPFPEWGCSRPNMPAAVEHLRMMNVSDLILRSDGSKAAAAKTTGLTYRRSFGPYEVYAVSANAPGYATVVRPPYAVITTDWKTTAYRWFKYADSEDAVPVYVQDAADTADVTFAGVFPDLPARDAIATMLAPDRRLQETVDTEHIRIAGVRPGDAVLFRMSYHPRWRAVGGEKVWLAGPGFMLVFANSDQVELRYAESAVTRAGLLISAVAAMIALAAVTGVFRRAWAGRIAGAGRRSSRRTVAQAFGRPFTQKTLPFAMLLCVASAILLIAGVRARGRDADRVYQAGQRDMDGGQTARARVRFAQARNLAPLSNTAIHSLYFEAIILYREQRWREASQVFQQLLARFPEAHAAAESSYHIGLCAERLGELREAVRQFAETRDQYPGTQWAQFAAERLRTLTVKP